MKTQQIDSFTESMNMTASYEVNGIRPSYLKLFLKYISNSWNYFTNLGVRKDQTVPEIKKTRLTNQFAFFGIIFSLLELPGYIYMQLLTSVISTAITCIFLFGVLFLSSRYLYQLAKTLHMLTINGVLLFASMYLGKEGGVHMYYFAMIILPFILFDLSEKMSISISLLVTVSAFYFSLMNESTIFRDDSITPAVTQVIFVSSLFGSFVAIIFCVYTLVKENTISEKRLGENETLFKGLLDATPDSTIITDSDGYITLCNKQVEEFFGYSADELSGKHVSILIPARLHSKTLKYFNAFSIDPGKRAKEDTGDLLIVKKDGVEVPVELSRNAYLAKSGTMMIMVIRDITERKKHEQELVQFSYVVSHDLKAPLRAIFKLSEWIEEEIGTKVSDNLKKNLQFLRGRVFRLEALINGLLEYAKIGRANVKKEKVNSRELVKEVIEMLSPPSTINITIQENMPVFETPKISLQQVFFNLLSNAIKYNDKEHGLISVTFNTRGKFYEFSVEDNGLGIDPIYHEKVFVIFQTLEARDKVEGTGIGLAILKKSVEDMGGTIKLRSELGKGAIFTFTWPQ